MSDKFYATGRRKNAIAKVWLTKGNGDIKINKKEISSYFPRETWVKHAIEALAITETKSDFDIRISVLGGGLTGQSGAIRLGISKALVLYNETLRSKLKPWVYLLETLEWLKVKNTAEKRLEEDHSFLKDSTLFMKKNLN